MQTVIVIVVAYLLGSLPFSYWIGKLSGKDLRREGSGNVGATNVLRTVGWISALIALTCDVVKGFFVPWVADYLDLGLWLTVISGLAVVCGHIYSLFLGFHGGKGVATALGVALALAPQPALCAVFIWIIVLGVEKYVSLASLLACWSIIPASIIGSVEPAYILLFFLLDCLITMRHAENIRRLVHGRELPIRSGGRR